MITTDIGLYFRDGCGRCDRFQTEDCKVRRWGPALHALRELLRQTPLVEEMKWGSPCYTADGKNVVALGALNDFAALQFFDGARLDDPDGALRSPGPNSHHARYMPFAGADDVQARRAQVLRYLDGAVAWARSGQRPPPPPQTEVPAELEARLADDLPLAAAFGALTPGRRRSHALYVGGAKQPETRARRAEACVPDILGGRGFRERT